MSRNTRNLLVLIAGLVLIAVALLVRNPATQEPSSPGQAGAPASAPAGSGSSSGSASDSGSGASIARSQLPPEARRTLELIRSDGPFPYDRDGVTFRNDERQLPSRPRGYYREYTVPTPGSSDRGARRIISGEGGELFYTDDHYRSFRRIQEDR